MPAGLTVNVSQLNQRAGSIALALKEAYEDAVDLNNWLLNLTGEPDPLTQEPYNMTADDAYILRTAFADLAYMKTSAFDSSATVKKLWGIGS
jgi:hypothetical protein